MTARRRFQRCLESTEIGGQGGGEVVAKLELFLSSGRGVLAMMAPAAARSVVTTSTGLASTQLPLPACRAILDPVSSDGAEVLLEGGLGVSMAAALSLSAAFSRASMAALMESMSALSWHGKPSGRGQLRGDCWYSSVRATGPTWLGTGETCRSSFSRSSFSALTAFFRRSRRRFRRRGTGLRGKILVLAGLCGHRPAYSTHAAAERHPGIGLDGACHTKA